jgi:hypothetical protein
MIRAGPTGPERYEEISEATGAAPPLQRGRARLDVLDCNRLGRMAEYTALRARTHAGVRRSLLKSSRIYLYPARWATRHSASNSRTRSMLSVNTVQEKIATRLGFSTFSARITVWYCALWGLGLVLTLKVIAASAAVRAGVLSDAGRLTLFRCAAGGQMD